MRIFCFLGLVFWNYNHPIAVQEIAIACEDGQFSCLTGVNETSCLSDSLMCNMRTKPDCTDGYDEDFTTCKSRKCAEGTFDCQYSREQVSSDEERSAESFCVRADYVCDGKEDCDKGEDELGCSKCSVLEEACPEDDSCIPRDHMCDGIPDCPDASDEHEHCNYTCAEGLISCTNTFQCYEPEDKCNGKKNCGDWSDEDPQICSQTECPTGKFQCKNKKCIDWIVICNSKDDCGDNSDEDQCYIQECSDPQKNNCSHGCQEYVIGFTCVCEDGFQLLGDGQQCVDIDECNELPLQCDDLCVNSVGSYSCSCKDGYSLGSDNKTCTQDQYVKPYIIFANVYYVRKMNLDGTDYELISDTHSHCHLVDADIADDVISYIDWDLVIIGNMNMSGGEDRIVFGPLSDSIEFEGIAVDWVTKKLYVTLVIGGYPTKGRLLVMEKNGTNYKTLSTETQRPRGVVVHPGKGYLFWTDWGDDACIWRMGMDGNNGTRLITQSVFWPNAIVVDVTQDRVFWGDAAFDRIMYADLDGKNIYTLIIDLQHIYSLSLFETEIFWVDWNTKVIEKVDRLTGKNRMRIKETIMQPFDMHVIHPSLQPKFANPCGSDNGGCSHLCLIAFGGGARTCACPADFKLDSDGQTCIGSCSSKEFECGRSDHRCIPKSWECDGSEDCGGGEDEHDECGTSKCRPGLFECEDRCITFRDVCDGYKDCDLGTDESNVTCSNWRCLSSEFQCSSGMCLPSSWECDDEEDCPQGDDEHDQCGVHKECSDVQFKCGNGKCIPRMKYCDLNDNCGDNSDEPRDICYDVTKNPCREGRSRCKTNYKCVPDIYHCDGDNDCGDWSDEMDERCPTCDPIGDFSCGSGECIPLRWRCDLDDDCEDASDEDQEMCEQQTRKCTENEFTCENKKCIPLSYQCDYDDDCLDGSDEDLSICTADDFKCSADNFQCDSGHCIFASFKCDSMKDCRDASDEKYCPTVAPGIYCIEPLFECPTHVCIPTYALCDTEDDCGDNYDESFEVCSKIDCSSSSRFKCPNGLCIYRFQMCDKINDCLDGTDENLDTCPVEGIVICNHDQFKCDNHQCVSNELVCDEVDDCGDHSDELGCHRPDESEGCGDDNGGCMQMCAGLSDGGHVCSCEPGYQVDPDNKKNCKDKDECAVWGNYCPQKCINKEGTYSCPCDEGFTQLKTQVDRCKPNIGHEGESILVAVEEAIRIFYSANNTWSDAIINRRKVNNMAVDASRRLVYWVDNRAVFRAAIPVDSRQLSSPQQLLENDILEPTAIAYDWIGQNIYITEMAKGRITVTTEDGSYRKTLLQDPLISPGCIVVNPALGKMYWVDPARGRIEEAWMDGTNVRGLVVSDLSMPTGITIDYRMNNRIYFVDEKLNRVESISADGNDRVIVAPTGTGDQLGWPLNNPYAIDVLHKSMVWSSKDGSVLQMDKFGRGVNVSVLGSGRSVVPSDVQLYQELKYDLRIPNPCAYKKCWPLCLLVPKDAVCACPNNFKLIDDSKCDKPKEEPKPIPRACYCENKGMCIYQAGKLGGPDVPVCKCLPGTSGAFCELGKVIPQVHPTELPPAPPQEKPSSNIILPLVIVVAVLLIIAMAVFVFMYKRGKFDGWKRSGHGEVRFGSAGNSGTTVQHIGEAVEYNVQDGVTTGFSNLIYDQVAKYPEQAHVTSEPTYDTIAPAPPIDKKEQLP